MTETINVADKHWRDVLPGDLFFNPLTWRLKADPVPESFEPERDAAGRPVLGEPGERVSCYASGEVPMVGDIVRLDGRIGTWVVASLRGDPKCGADTDIMVRMEGGVHVCGGRAANNCLVRRATRDAVELAPAEAYVAKTPSDIDLPSRYAAFRETVERVVAAEAPAAKVVTDWSERPWRGINGGPMGFAHLSCGEYMMVFSCSLRMVDVEAWERDTKQQVGFMRDSLGTAAMGKVGAKERGR